MATIEKRVSKSGTVTYRVKIRVIDQPPITASFPKKTEAKLWAQKMEHEIRYGKYLPDSLANTKTVTDLIDRYIAEVGNQKKSIKDYISCFDWWKKKLGDFPLAKITNTLLYNMQSELKTKTTNRYWQKQHKTISPSTVNRYFAYMSAAFSKALKWGWVTSNPFILVEKLKEPPGRVRFLSDEERKIFLEECKKVSSRFYTIILIALTTGARRSEIMNLTWDKVDLENQVMLLSPGETKNNEARALPITEEICKLINDLPRKKSTKLLFPGKNPANPYDIRKSWAKAIKASGIENFRFHDLRHSCASYLAMNGVSHVVIADILGHKTMQMVQRYSHLNNKSRLETINNMAEKFLK
jgi:integrase